MQKQNTNWPVAEKFCISQLAALPVYYLGVYPD